MTEIPNTVPSTFAAGDTVSWRRDLPDYRPADGWALNYTFVSAAAAYTVAAAAVGPSWAVDLSAATTATWAPHIYKVQEWVVRAAERYSLATYAVRITPNLAAATDGLDLRTHARRVLDAIEAWLETRAPTVGQVEVAGRRISHYPLTDLLALRDRYRADVMREEHAAAGQAGSRLLVRL